MTNWKLFKKFLISFGLVVIPLIAILSFFFAHSSRLQRENAHFLNENLALQTVSFVQKQVELAENMCKAILQNEMLTTFLDREFHSPSDLTYYQTTVQSFVKVTNGVSDIKLKLFLENDTIPMGFNIFFPMRYLDYSPQIKAFYEDVGQDSLWLDGSYEYHGDEKYKPNPTDSFCYFLKIKSGADQIGIIMASIPKHTFSIEQPDDADIMAPLFLDNYIIYNHTSQTLSAQTIEALIKTGAYKGFSGTSHDLPDGPFRVLIVTKYSENNLIAPTFILICIACAILTGIYILLTRHLLRDIYHCLDGIEAAAQHNFKADAGESYIHDVLSARNDEIATLAQRILFLMDRIRALIQQNVREQTAAKQIQLLALQHQINPHFLYNTMEVFSSRMELAGLYEESAAISAFCRMLRYNINSEDMATLAGELEQMQNYLAIQEIKNLPFTISTRIPDHLKQERVIRFLLEPFIENCFKYHGNTGTLQIVISAEDFGPDFSISIENNGESLSEARMGELNHRFMITPANVHTNGDKIGLNNINSRLKLFYGDTYFIQVSCVDNRTRFTFMIKKQ